MLYILCVCFYILNNKWRCLWDNHLSIYIYNYMGFSIFHWHVWLPEGKADNKQSPIFLEIGGIYMYIPCPNGRFTALGPMGWIPHCINFILGGYELQNLEIKNMFIMRLVKVGMYIPGQLDGPSPLYGCTQQGKQGNGDRTSRKGRHTGFVWT